MEFIYLTYPYHTVYVAHAISYTATDRGDGIETRNLSMTAKFPHLTHTYTHLEASTTCIIKAK